ncbi:transcriptional regulator [Terrabacter tumescens]|uniref:Transcriptional regulator n=1 Tax=Terrabacter tumescens TaxID=60443 RepID=A0ABQ2IFQ5_9MICO|nr:transcriptional regulator [Terrabacter tumescens]
MVTTTKRARADRTDDQVLDAQAPDDGGTDDLVTALLTGSRVLVGVSARSLAEVEDAVTLSQFRTLVVLQAHGPTRLNQLATRLAVGPSTALRSVDRLIAAGFVARTENAQDRREVVIALTDAGRALVTEVTERRRAAIRAIVEAMPASQRHTLVDALIAFSAAADEPVALADAATRLGW